MKQAQRIEKIAFMLNSSWFPLSSFPLTLRLFFFFFISLFTERPTLNPVMNTLGACDKDSCSEVTVEGNQLVDLLLTRKWSETQTQSSSGICLHNGRKVLLNSGSQRADVGLS